MGRVAVLALGLTVALARPSYANDSAAISEHLTVFVDHDDDDADGLEDRRDDDGGGLEDTLWIELPAPARIDAISGDVLRVRVGANWLDAATWKGPIMATRVGVQGLHPGTATLAVDGAVRTVDVVQVDAVDTAGRVLDLARSHASVSRVVPPPLGTMSDLDALRWRFMGPESALPAAVRVVSVSPEGTVFDATGLLSTEPVACPSGSSAQLVCRQTDLVRATVDLVDRGHLAVSTPGVAAEVGGRLLVFAGLRKVASIRVGGPRESTATDVGRHRATMRVRVLRMTEGGRPAVGRDDRDARRIIAEQVQQVSALWGQCGVHFGPVAAVDVAIVDPPVPNMLAVGCEGGALASGGRLAFQVRGRQVGVPILAGESPSALARRVRAALVRAGFEVRVSPNATVLGAVTRSVDLLVFDDHGAPVPLGAEARVSTDPTLDVCIGHVGLADGLRHFSDGNAASGTVEERALLKAVMDADDRTIDVVVVPAFGATTRVGEAFIDGDRSSLRNVIIIDRAGVQAASRSAPLAHEVGHVLLDLPGHPDDYGVDRPSLLMDADASDPTVFGPRRIPVDVCERALRQSGEGAHDPMLLEWPLFGGPPGPANAN